MEKHLIASGYALSECGLTSALPGSLVTELEDMNCRACRLALIKRGMCPVCGKQRLSWRAHPRNKSGVANGRLTLNDVETIFYLACDYCSETLISRVDPEDIAAALTMHGWRP